MYISNGQDSQAPIRFLPANANSTGLIFTENEAFVATRNNCGGVANGVWSIALAGTNSALTGAAAIAPAPLKGFVNAVLRPSPIAINHQSHFPVVTLSFNLAPGASLGAAVQHIKGATQELGMPASIEPSFQGTAHAFESSLANESVLILAAIVTVYIVLGMLYESVIHPITILSTLPSAGVGAILALVVFRKDLDVTVLPTRARIRFSSAPRHRIFIGLLSKAAAANRTHVFREPTRPM